jgi:peptide/nickel transport system substrate-binding protein
MEDWNVPKRFRLTRRLACGFVAVSTLLLGAVVITSPVSGASGQDKTIVTLALPPGISLNYIFPYMTGAYFGDNLDDLQLLMYRPLYWFGTQAKEVLNSRLSLADTPVSSNGGKTFKITLKTYKWSDGTKVTTTNIMFWLNLWKMKPTGYAGWFPGGLSMPTSIKSVHITSPTTLTITFDRSFNPHWLLYNELAQITPLPTAWTKTSSGAAAGSGGCATAAFGANDAACKAVYVYLSEQSGFDPTKPKTTIDALPTYATNPLWQVVDGAWELKSFAPTAPTVFVPNPSYSGPNKPTIKEYIEKPYTTGSAEFNALVAGTVDVGILPATVITSEATSPSRPSQTVKPGSNNPRLSSTYDLNPVYDWGVNFFPYNFKSTGDTGQAGKIFSQLYFRQAFQRLVDQPAYIDRLEHGYAVPTYGPVPLWPHNPYSSRFEGTNPYPYSPAAAKSLLSSHGWKVTPNGTDTCKKPGIGAGDCGKGIKKGAKLSFTLQYSSGTKTLSHLMDAEKASWGGAGIHINLSSADFNTILGNAALCPKGCSWEFEDWGSGWGFLPDFYPTGEEIFATGAESNPGDFSTATNNANIKATDTTTVGLAKYEDYLTKELPVVWQPEVMTLYEFNKALKHPGINSLLNTPATWHWS